MPQIESEPSSTSQPIRPDDANLLDPALWPASAHRDRDGQLVIAGRTAGQLVEQFSSPLYVIDEAEFRGRARAFVAAFPGWTVNYAGKAFLCRTVARWVDQEGLNLDVCSGNELALALSAGFPAARIGLHGNNKSVEELALAIDSGVGRIIVDCFEEIARIEALASQRAVSVPVLLRLTTGVAAHTHTFIATAHEDQKFGFSIHSGAAHEALLACQASPHIRVTGLHSHIGSQIFDTDGFRVAAERVLGLLAQWRDETWSELEEINLGGGFGIAYTAEDAPLSPLQLHDQLADIIDQTLAARGLAPLTVAIEPGRAICGPAGVALYRVGVVKPVDVARECQRLYIAVDGGMSDNIRTALYDADYTAVLANRVSAVEPRLSRVVGKHCESGDILVREVYLPGDVRPGDLIAVPAMGAYSRSLASNYNYATRPAVVAVNAGVAYPLLRRETLADLLALDAGAVAF